MAALNGTPDNDVAECPSCEAPEMYGCGNDPWWSDCKSHATVAESDIGVAAWPGVFGCDYALTLCVA